MVSCLEHFCSAHDYWGENKYLKMESLNYTVKGTMSHLDGDGCHGTRMTLITAWWQPHKSQNHRRGLTDIWGTTLHQVHYTYHLVKHRAQIPIHQLVKVKMTLKVFLVFPDLPMLMSLSLCPTVFHFGICVCADRPASEWWMTAVPFCITKHHNFVLTKEKDRSNRSCVIYMINIHIYIYILKSVVKVWCESTTEKNTIKLWFRSRQSTQPFYMFCLIIQ